MQYWKRYESELYYFFPINYIGFRSHVWAPRYLRHKMSLLVGRYYNRIFCSRHHYWYVRTSVGTTELIELLDLFIPGKQMLLLPPSSFLLPPPSFLLPMHILVHIRHAAAPRACFLCWTLCTEQYCTCFVHLRTRMVLWANKRTNTSFFFAHEFFLVIAINIAPFF